MSAYYYLVAGLPDIAFDDGKLSYSIDDFRSELYPDLSDKDRKLTDLFFLQYDNNNLITLLRDKDACVGRQGLYAADELLQMIDKVKNDDVLEGKYPSYFQSFIVDYLSLPEEEHYKAQDLLAAYYYDYAMKCGNSFVSSWFEFSLNMNNIQAALAARKYKYEVADVIVGHTEVCDLLRTSNARDFGLNEVIGYFDAVQRLTEIEDLVEREKKVDLMKWNWLEDESFFHYFTIERIFVFLIKLDIIERWVSMDKEKGSELFRKMIDALKDDVRIPDEFTKQ